MKRIVLLLLLTGCIDTSVTTPQGYSFRTVRLFMDTSIRLATTLPDGTRLELTYGTDVSAQLAAETKVLASIAADAARMAAP